MQNYNGKYPFLYIRYTKNVVLGGIPEKYVVSIASHCDHKYANTEWMCDPKLPADRTFQLDVDLEESIHEFNTPEDAIQFIASWWKNNNYLGDTVRSSNIANQCILCDQGVSHSSCDLG